MDYFDEFDSPSSELPSLYLRLMQELPMHELKSDEAYRLLVLSDGPELPLMVRVQSKAGRHTVESKRFNGKVDYFSSPPKCEPGGKVTMNRSRTLTDAEWLQLKDEVAKSSFWTLPAIQPSKGAIESGATLWWLEGSRPGHHHVVKCAPEAINLKRTLESLEKKDF